jgi:hypothetical protein
MEIKVINKKNNFYRNKNYFNLKIKIFRFLLGP